MMNDLTFNILKIVISVCVALITYKVIPYIKCRMQSARYAELLEMIDIAVRAAEQTVSGSGMGVLKKDNVVIFLNKWLYEKGIKISQEQLNHLIEAAVFNMNHE